MALLQFLLKWQGTLTGQTASGVVIASLSLSNSAVPLFTDAHDENYGKQDDA